MYQYTLASSVSKVHESSPVPYQILTVLQDNVYLAPNPSKDAKQRSLILYHKTGVNGEAILHLRWTNGTKWV